MEAALRRAPDGLGDAASSDQETIAYWARSWLAAMPARPDGRILLAPRGCTAAGAVAACRRGGRGARQCIC